jgi:hypothetical protein
MNAMRIDVVPSLVLPQVLGAEVYFKLEELSVQ